MVNDVVKTEDLVTINQAESASCPAPAQSAQLALEPVANPEAQVEAAARVARALKQVVDQAGLALELSGRQYLKLEGWQTVARFFNVTARITWTRPIEQDGARVGWEAKAEVITADGRVVGSAEAQCCRDEKPWKSRPGFALRAMAQTRAQARALRSVFAFVPVLAGIEPTPAEEIEALEPAASGRRKTKKTNPLQVILDLADREQISRDALSAYVRETFGRSLDRLDVKELRQLYRALRDDEFKAWLAGPTPPDPNDPF